MERIFKDITYCSEERKENIKEEIFLLTQNPKGYKLINILIEKYFLMEKVHSNYCDITRQLHCLLYRFINQKCYIKGDFEKAQELYIDYEKCLPYLREAIKNMKKSIKNELLNNFIHTEEVFKDLIKIRSINKRFHNYIIKAGQNLKLTHQKLAS